MILRRVVPSLDAAAAMSSQIRPSLGGGSSLPRRHRIGLPGDQRVDIGKAQVAAMDFLACQVIKRDAVERC